MPDFILFMHDDTRTPVAPDAWEPYLTRLRASGCFAGGSSIGTGACFARGGRTPGALATHLTGFLRVSVDSIEDATRFLEGNPVYEAGGTVEIRELPRD